MLKTIINPNGEAVISHAVECDGCGEVVTDGWMPVTCTPSLRCIDSSKHYCDECAENIEDRAGFRICKHCGLPMTDGMTNLETVYLHEECFEPWMNANCEEWREVEDDGLDGYYEERIDGKWRGTGIFYTTWY